MSMTENKPDTGVGSDLKIPEKKGEPNADRPIIQGAGDWVMGKYHDEKTPDNAGKKNEAK